MMMASRDDIETDGFRQLFLREYPLLDVRAPIEFATGSFPSAVNLPILDDQQRHEIGLRYASGGQQAAIDLGIQLATPELRHQRLEQWRAFIKNQPDGYIVCFRGGLRSQTTQNWLREVGVDFPLVRGGYKALRKYLLEELQKLCEDGNILLVSGATGVGKTELIQNHRNSIDLEGRAKHRGSAFGKTSFEQPSQINWENQIIIDWLRCHVRSKAPILIEAESSLIGRICLPKNLRDAMMAAPCIILEASLDERIERLLKDYVQVNLQNFQSLDQPVGQQTQVDPYTALSSNFLENLSRIKKRLGSENFNMLSQETPKAVLALREYDDFSGFVKIIKCLLVRYYDPLYNYHLEKTSARVIFRGNMQAVQDYLS